MVEVLSFGDRMLVPNPAVPGEQQEMVNVVFIERGRKGANQGLANSSDALSLALGIQTGLEQVRTHTQPVKVDAAEQLQIGQQIPNLHINRKLYSTPQIRNQVDKDPRMIDGKPTFFLTELSTTPEEDVDERLSIDVIASLRPADLVNAQVGAVNTYRTTNAGEGGHFVAPNQPTTVGARIASPTIPAATKA